MNDPARKSIPARIYDVLSGFGLATILLVILMIQTWLATLEQVHYGLHATLQKYFDIHQWYILPDAGVFSEGLLGKHLPPLPGGYWVCALLALNLTLGGLVRMRKGWKTAGVLMSHFSIVFMIIAGGVAQLKEERGVMMLSEEQDGPLPKTADYANSFTETTVEITEIKDGKPVGPVHFIKDAYYLDLGPGDVRKVNLPKLPFDIALQGYVQNAKAISTSSMAPSRGEVALDGWFIFSQEPNKETELDSPGLHARIMPRDGSKPQDMLLVATGPESFGPRAPVTVRSGDRTFTVRLDKRVWPVPFQVTLVDARSEYHPNTSRPKLFESDVIRTQNGQETKHFIEMNEPMRQGGLTLYQRTMMNGPSGAGQEATISGFEVVRNPSDKWPEWSIYIASIGLCVHFITKLVTFLRRGKSTPVPQA
ncbi:cytochrome c biogenesis protein ResB [Luteolibacter flavescens]|uniref:Cytochrome c biogenesis protein ResB n=1 Tax=Luteolibacter flavescens TaxID=1859460 RepID=A0ABT3FRZ3_9BACT|nr:cytochrome c biogenesis protein ResB [Luteolibacter flavescens]MCW1886222.1 cytochrome c biogenesis protein ResB [Luteolibacter flavescens]